ncbi:hypothetical protein HDU76_001143 [Blyttiomyces sp. JEL0837]|nr:hypothetical protein HDU76_001143 [Blyttiomyces sp. JEL0837]
MAQVWLTAIVFILAVLGLLIQLWRSRTQSYQSAQLVSRNTSVIQPSTGLLKEPKFEPWDKSGRWALVAQIASYILLAYGTYLIASVLGLLIQLWRSRTQSYQSAQLVSRNTSISTGGQLKEPKFEPWDKSGRWALVAQIASYILLAYGTYLIASGIYTAIKTSDGTGVVAGIAQIMGGIATVFLWRSLLLPVRAVVDDMEVDVVDDLKKRREKQAQSVVSHVAVAGKDVGEAGKLANGQVVEVVNHAAGGVHYGPGMAQLQPQPPIHYVPVHPQHVGITIDPSSGAPTSHIAQTMAPSPAYVPVPHQAGHIIPVPTPATHIPTGAPDQITNAVSNVPIPTPHAPTIPTGPEPVTHLSNIPSAPIAPTRHESMLASPSSSSSGGLTSGQQASAIAVGGAAAAITAHGVNPQLHTIIPGGGSGAQQMVQGGVTTQPIANGVSGGVSGTTTTAAAGAGTAGAGVGASAGGAGVTATLGGIGSTILGNISTIAIGITIGSIAVTTISTTIPGGASPLGILPPTPANIDSHFGDSNGCLCSNDCINALTDLSNWIESQVSLPNSAYRCLDEVANSAYADKCIADISQIVGSVPVGHSSNFDTTTVHGQFVHFDLNNMATTVSNTTIFAGISGGGGGNGNGIGTGITPAASGFCSASQFGCLITIIVRESVCYGYSRSSQLASSCCVSP